MRSCLGPLSLFFSLFLFHRFEFTIERNRESLRDIKLGRYRGGFGGKDEGIRVRIRFDTFFSADFVEGIGVQNCDVFLIFVFLNKVSSIVAVEKVNKESVFLYLDKVC